MNPTFTRTLALSTWAACALVFVGTAVAQQATPMTAAEERQAARRAAAERELTEMAERIQARLAELKAASEADPEDYEALAEYALGLSKAGQIDEALTAITRASTRAPNEPKILLMQAKTLWKADRPDLAVEAALKVTKSPLASQTQVAEAYFTAGSIRMREDRREDAAKYLRYAIEADENNYGALLNLGLIMSQQNQGIEALRLMELASKKAPKNPRVQSTYALYLEEIGLTNRAHEAWVRLVGIVPNDADLRIKVGSSYIINNEYEKAHEHIGKAVELNPHDANAHLLFSQVLLRMGNYDQARKHAGTARDLGASADHMFSAIDFEEQQAGGSNTSGS